MLSIFYILLPLPSRILPMSYDGRHVGSIPSYPVSSLNISISSIGSQKIFMSACSLLFLLCQPLILPNLSSWKIPNF